MYGRSALILVCLALAAAGARNALAQADPFAQAACQEEFLKLRSELDKRGLALKAASERQASAQEACPLFRRYTETEARIVKFFAEKQAICEVPDEIVKQAKERYAQAVAVRDDVCRAAAGPPPPPPPPPSQGLSGALGAGALGPPPETTGGSGVFDTLTGNVLRR